MESLTSTATKVPGLRKKVMVDMDRLTELSEELRTSIPTDIQEAREVLKQKAAVLNQASLEARRIKEAAQNQAASVTEKAEHAAASVTEKAMQDQITKVDESEIVKEAEQKGEQIHQAALQEAQEITQNAQRRAYEIMEEAEALVINRREGADQYARETLFELEERLAGVLAQVRRGIDTLGLEVEVKIPS